MARDAISERMRNQARKKERRKPYVETPDFKRDVAAIEAGLGALEISAAHLAKMIGMSGATLSQTLNGKYAGNVEEVLDKAKRTLDRMSMEQVQSAVMPFVETSVYKTIRFVCEEAFTNRTTDSIGLVPAHVGVGKTTALKRFCILNDHALYIRCATGMSRKVVMERLLRKLNKTTEGKTISAIQDAVVRALEERPRLLILDEASKATNDVLECLRDICDDSESGLVFVGREYLAERLASNEGILGEISSRILTRVTPIKRLKETDVYLIVEASAIAGAGDDVKEMIWECSEANGRVLHRLMIKLSKYAEKNGIKKLKPDVVSNIYQQYVKSSSIGWRNHQH